MGSMSDNKETTSDDLNVVPPLVLRQLRRRLARCESESFEEQVEMVKQILDLGKEAESLMPLLIEKYRSDKLIISPLWLVDLYVNTHDASLLQVMVEKHQLPTCDSPDGIFQLCKLFDNGLPFMEESILTFLAKNQLAEPASLAAVKSLGKFGGELALEELEVVRYELSGELPEKKAKWMLSPEEDFKHIVARLEYGAHEEFLNEVRSAIACIKQRIKDHPTPPTGDALGHNPTEARRDVDIEERCKRIEIDLANFVLNVLKKANLKDWWEEYVPMDIRQKCANRQEEENNRITMKEAYFDLIDLKKVMHKNWTLFEQQFREAKREGGKEKCLAWLDDVNKARRFVGHPLKKELSGHSFSEPEKASLAEAEDLARRLRDKFGSGPSPPNGQV